MATETLNLAIHGMTCANCARSVERKLLGVPGATKITVSLAAASANVEYDTDLVEPEMFAKAARELGFEAS
jgi:copper chaperone CopZ